MDTQHWWNGIGRGKSKCSENNLYLCNFVYHKYHMVWPGIEIGLCGERPATNSLSHGMATTLTDKSYVDQCSGEIW